MPGPTSQNVYAHARSGGASMFGGALVLQSAQQSLSEGVMTVSTPVASGETHVALLCTTQPSSPTTVPLYAVGLHETTRARSKGLLLLLLFAEGD